MHQSIRLILILVLSLWHASSAIAQSQEFDASKHPDAHTVQNIVDEAGELVPLFYFGKNTNLNLVHYYASMASDCTLMQNPVVALWHVLPDEAPNAMTQYESLSWFEQKFVYGPEVQSRDDHNAVINIAADETRTLSVQSFRNPDQTCNARTTAFIAGVYSEAVSAFAVITPRFMRAPKVHFVNIYGQAISSTTRTCETLTEVGVLGKPCDQ